MKTLISIMVLMLFMIDYSSASEPITFEVYGYFKHNKNRIKTVEMSVKPNEINSTVKKQALSFGRNSTNTPGRLTSIYFYTANSVIPSEQLTLAKSVFSANDVLYEDKDYSSWIFAYMKALTGEEIFIDCREKPKDFLCRQR